MRGEVEGVLEVVGITNCKRQRRWRDGEEGGYGSQAAPRKLLCMPLTPCTHGCLGNDEQQSAEKMAPVMGGGEIEHKGDGSDLGPLS